MVRKAPLSLLILLLFTVLVVFLVSCETVGETEPTATARPGTAVPTRERPSATQTAVPEPATPAMSYPTPEGTSRPSAYP